MKCGTVFVMKTGFWVKKNTKDKRIFNQRLVQSIRVVS